MLSVGKDKQMIVWDMVTMNQLYAMDAGEIIWQAAVMGSKVVAIAGEAATKIMVWDFKINLTEIQGVHLVDSIELPTKVTAILPLSFRAYLLLGLSSGRLLSLDAALDIAEEVPLLHTSLDLLLECRLNAKLKSCVIGASREDCVVRVVSWRKSEEFVEVGWFRVKAPVVHLQELRDMLLAIALKSGDLEIWSLKNTQLPIRTLNTNDSIISLLTSVEEGQFLLGLTKDARVMIWKTATGQCLFVSDYPIHIKKVTWLLLYGDKLFTASLDGFIRATGL